MEWTASGDSKFDLLSLEVLTEEAWQPFACVLHREVKLKQQSGLALLRSFQSFPSVFKIKGNKHLYVRSLDILLKWLLKFF